MILRFIITFIITSLAAYRLTRFITTDIMPFSGIRNFLLDRWDGTIYAEGLTCPACMGAWVSFALVGALAQITSIRLPALYALAVSSAVILTARIAED